MVVEKSFSKHGHGVAVIGKVRTQSGMHSPSRLEAFLKTSRAMEQNLCRLLRFGKLHEPFYTTVSPSTLTQSRCYAPAACPECCRQNTAAISRTIDAHAPAVIPGYLSCRRNKLTQAQVCKLYENFTYTPLYGRLTAAMCAN